MKKRNIVRFTAFIMAMLMCTSSAVTLFAEGVDSTEESVIEATESVTTEATESPSEESASEAITEDETETQTVSGNETTPTEPTRSELGQKILDFKNPDKYNGQVLFKGNLYNIDSSDLDFSHSDLYYAAKDEVKIGLYNKDTDELKFCGTLKITSSEYDEVDNSDFYKSSINDASIKSYKDGVADDIYIGLNPMNRTSSTPDEYKNTIICLFDKSTSDTDLSKGLLFVCTLTDSVKYAKSSLEIDSTEPVKNKSISSVRCERVEDSNSVQKVKVTVDFSIVDSIDYSSPEFDAYFEQRNFIKERRNTATVVKILKDNKVIKSTVLTDDGTGLIAGSCQFYITNGNGKYSYIIETLLSGLGRINTDLTGDFEVTEFKLDVPDVVISDEELKGATVSFSGMPSEAYTDDSVTLKMNTDKKCKMSFNGSSLANDEYTTSADFVVSRNGTYSYTATNEQGVATNGTFEVTFFKDKVADAIEDPLQMDLVSAKTDSNLSQTGLYQIWLIILAVILCSFGILLIVNQKYHFLDKFIRRFKHESN